MSRGNGSALAVIVGGATEALHSRPGTADLVLLRRKGFFRMALRHGARLAPVYAFGETELYRQYHPPDNSVVRLLQSAFQSASGAAFPLFTARGVFQYSAGLLPNRRQIRVVVGAALECPTILNPSDEDVRLLQTRYVAGLEALYNKYRGPGDADLKLVD